MTEIRPMVSADAAAVLDIFRDGIATGHATFESEAGSWQNFDVAHLQTCRLVAVAPDGSLLGWFVLSPVSARAVYAGVAEVSLYVATRAGGRGVGGALMDAGITASEENNIWTLQAAIFPENEISIGLHSSRGFLEVGLRRHIGKMRHGPKAGAWRDVVFMERRSQITGRD